MEEVSQYADGIGSWLPQIIEGDKTSNLVKLAHKYNMKVHPYTFKIDDLPKNIKAPNELLKLLFNDLRVDGLFTDFPDIVKGFLK